MALMICPECGRNVSDKAKSCPNCGCPIDTRNDLYMGYSVVFKGFRDKFSNYDKIYEIEKDISEESGIPYDVFHQFFYNKSIPKKTPFILFGALSKNNADMIAKIIRRHDGVAEIESTNKPIGTNDRISLNEKLSVVAERKAKEKNAPVTCPRCGSTSITTGQRGYKLLTGFWGSNKTVNRCGKCGYSWEPK